MRDSPRIVIVAQGTISSLGASFDESIQSYQSGLANLSKHNSLPVAKLNKSAEGKFQAHLSDEIADRVNLLAELASVEAWDNAGWERKSNSSTAVLIGSSRGATGAWEHYFEQYILSEKSKVATRCSPYTTFGNISSSVAKRLNLDGVAFDHSVTCSTGLHAFLNGTALLRSGYADNVLVGGSEAPITDFTLAQMKAHRIYTSGSGSCPLSTEESNYNSFMLGEGAAIFALERETESRQKFYLENQCPIVDGLGCAQEFTEANTGITEEGTALATAMKRALSRRASNEKIDAIYVHAPGTLKGDRAELKAIQSVFGSDHPQVLSNKWLIGHTFGASGPLSLICAMALLRGAKPPKPPYQQVLEYEPLSEYKTIMINSTGFGGNAISLIVHLPTWE